MKKYEIQSEEVLNLKNIKIDLSYFFKLPATIIKKNKVILLSGNSEFLNVGIVPGHFIDRSLTQIQRQLNLPLKVNYISEESLEAIISKYLRSINIALQKNLQLGLTPNQDPINFCNTLLALAVLKESSDVHLDPELNYFSIGFRIDGNLNIEKRIAIKFYSPIINRLKVLSNMKITETREPQDGYIRYNFDGLRKVVDLRTATLPTRFGERISLRIIDTQTSKLTTIGSLGFSEKHKEIFERSINFSHGLVLLTGPTGSGKTTTLYASMAELAARENLKIIAFEDPIERDLEGVTQVQVGEKVSFNNALKSVLRHDPDVIMVGEIRDRETADIAVRSAITGHLVLSTLHTNSAVSTVARLIDLGIDPFILAAVLRLVTAQRLVKKLCKNCCVPRKITEYEAQILGDPSYQEKTVYKASEKGCQFCAGKGFNGRVSVIELLENKITIAQAISRGASDLELRKIMNKEKMESLLHNGLQKALNKECCLDEIIRVSIGH